MKQRKARGEKIGVDAGGKDFVIRGKSLSRKPCKIAESRELLMQRTFEMTDKESKAYEKLTKNGNAYVGTNIFMDENNKHVRFAQFYLYKKEK